MRTRPGAGPPFSCCGTLGVGGCTSATVSQVAIRVVPSRRQMRVTGLRLMFVWSVFLRGSVHSRSTLLPRREAVRSSTGTARLSEGSCGAPGVPHPQHHAISRALPISPTGQSFMEANRVANQLSGLWKRIPVENKTQTPGPSCFFCPLPMVHDPLWQHLIHNGATHEPTEHS